MKSPQAAALKAAALSTLLAAKVKTANAELAGTKASGGPRLHACRACMPPGTRPHGRCANAQPSCITQIYEQPLPAGRAAHGWPGPVLARLCCRAPPWLTAPDCATINHACPTRLLPLQLAVAVIQGGKVVKPGALPSKPDAVATLLNRALLGNGYFDKVGWGRMGGARAVSEGLHAPRSHSASARDRRRATRCLRALPVDSNAVGNARCLGRPPPSLKHPTAPHRGRRRPPAATAPGSAAARISACCAALAQGAACHPPLMVQVSRQPVVPGGPTQPFAIFHPKVRLASRRSMSTRSCSA